MDAVFAVLPLGKMAAWLFPGLAGSREAALSAAVLCLSTARPRE
jgi:hypothetical protein